jgi:protein ImuB
VDAAALAALADRIGARLGPEAVGVLAPRASHIPERAEALERFEGALPDWSDDAAAPGPRPPRMLERPEPIEVVAGVPDGPPVRFVWRRVARQVVRAEGPERIAPEWWDLSERRPRARDYYRVEDASGRRYWLFREGLYGDGRGGAPRWFVHGLFA